jgi:DNA polymerase III alpha subunit
MNVMIRDRFGQIKIDEWELAKQLYERDIDLTKAALTDPDDFNAAVRATGMPYPHIIAYSEPDCAIDEWHKRNQSNWHYPKEYENFDIEGYLRLQCKNAVELERVTVELELFRAHNLENMLKYMIYLVHVMQANDIVWGVGRGSSVASFVLFLIGVHKVDSLRFSLDIKEFFKD